MLKHSWSNGWDGRLGLIILMLIVLGDGKGHDTAPVVEFGPATY